MTQLLAIVRIDIRTRNPLRGGHGITKGAMFAHAAERKKQRGATAQQCRYKMSRIALGDPKDIVERMRVKLTRIAPSSGLDDDGLTAALKSVRDGVADFLGINDRARIWDYEQLRGRKGEYAVMVEFNVRETGAAPDRITYASLPDGPMVAGDFGETALASGEATPSSAPLGRLVGKERQG